jgi:hypothetical protein
MRGPDTALLARNEAAAGERGAEIAQFLETGPERRCRTKGWSLKKDHMITCSYVTGIFWAESGMIPAFLWVTDPENRR